MSPNFLLMYQFPYVFVWVLLKADPETRMWVQTVDFGGDLTKHGKGGLKWPRKGTRADKLHVNKQQLFGAGGAQCHCIAHPSEPLFSNPDRLAPETLSHRQSQHISTARGHPQAQTQHWQPLTCTKLPAADIQGRPQGDLVTVPTTISLCNMCFLCWSYRVFFLSCFWYIILILTLRPPSFIYNEPSV